MKHNLSIKLKNEKINPKLLAEIIRNEFIDSCERIIIDSQPKFINNFYSKIFLLLKNYYSINIFSEKKELNNLLYQNKIDFITNIYSPMFKLCSFAINQYNSKTSKIEANKNISYLFHYRPHCMLSATNKKNNNNFKTIATHFCGGKLIIVPENNSEYENNIKNNDSFFLKNNSYIICTKCKRCYLDECFPMMCCNCGVLFYSEVIKEKNNKDNCYLATWYKYHCKNINNEKMSCIKCGNDFWIKDNKLFCKNCKFEIEPTNIIWTCLVCNSEFNSEVKVYNKYEFKLAQLILKQALIYKKIVKPAELPCKCFQNKEKIKEKKFYHLFKNNTNNKECKGLIYFCEVNDKKYLVCSKCFNIYSINKFKWTCPLCLKSFFNSRIKILNSKISNNKNRNSIFTNINLNKDALLNSENINCKLKTSKNSPKRHEKSKSILESYNSLKMNNKIHREDSLSLNKTNNLKLNVNNSDSNNKRNKKIIKRNSSVYYPTPSGKNKYIHKRIFTLSNIGFLINNNNKNKDIIKKDKKSNKIISIFNNSYFHDLNLRKKRNLSFLPSEIKNDINLTSFQNSKNDNKPITNITSSILSSSSNYNISGKKEKILKIDSNLLNRKVISNNNNFILNKNEKNNFINYNNKTIDSKNNKNLIFQNSLCNINKKNINNEIHSKNNNVLIGQKVSYQKEERKTKSKNKDSINNQKGFNLKEILKHKKGSKSFCINHKKLLLLNVNASTRNIAKENIIKDINKRKSLKNKNILTINNSQIELNNIKIKSINISRIQRKNRNIILKGKNDLLNFSSRERKLIKNKSTKNNKFKLNILKNFSVSALPKLNLSTTNNNSKSKIYGSSKKKKNIKIKNIRITIDNPRIVNNINYNLSFTNNNPQIPNTSKNNNISNNISINSKLRENDKNILNYYIPKKASISFIEKKELKKFDINDYTIITQLGQGSFGKIYLAKDSNKNIFSIKKILLSEELDVKSVIAEYNMCYNFSHPNIIKIMGIYSNKLDKTTFVVYVLMEVGISDWEKEINSLKAKNIKYSENDLFNILKQLVSACSFLQKNNISHRDIKPQNILVFKNKIYKLIDFGEARRIQDLEKNNKSLIQYSLKGTELYMSPLLFNGLRSGQIDVNHNVYKSDVYSLGLCMLYAAASFDKPLFEIRRIIEMEKIKNYINSVLKENYSEKLINIIISMLKIHERERPDFLELEKLIENI